MRERFNRSTGAGLTLQVGVLERFGAGFYTPILSAYFCRELYVPSRDAPKLFLCGFNLCAPSWNALGGGFSLQLAAHFSRRMLISDPDSTAFYFGFHPWLHLPRL